MTRAADTSRDADLAGALPAFDSPFPLENLILHKPSSK